MTWFTLVKISTEHAIRDVEEFAPEMLEEQKKLDKEEEERVKQLTRAKEIKDYMVPLEQLPRIRSFSSTSTRTRYGRRYIDYSNFLMSYIPYFTTDEEIKEFRANRRNILEWKKKFEFYYDGVKPSVPTSKDKQELMDMKNRNDDIHIAAIFRWNQWDSDRKEWGSWNDDLEEYKWGYEK